MTDQEYYGKNSEAEIRTRICQLKVFFCIVLNN